jgi:hypothetical protein
MRIQRVAVVLTAINFLVLLVVGVRLGSTGATRDAPVLRGRALELVDERGQVRAQLDVVSDEVVFRLRDAKGTVRVKLGADESGSGLLLLDEATEPAVHAIARRVGSAESPLTTRITLRGADGRQRVLKPGRPGRR